MWESPPSWPNGPDSHSRPSSSSRSTLLFVVVVRRYRRAIARRAVAIVVVVARRHSRHRRHQRQLRRPQRRRHPFAIVVVIVSHRDLRRSRQWLVVAFSARPAAYQLNHQSENQGILRGGNTSWVMKVMFVNCGRMWSPKIPPPPELKKTSFAFFSVRPLEKRRLSGFRKSTRQILKATFLLAQSYIRVY